LWGSVQGGSVNCGFNNCAVDAAGWSIAHPATMNASEDHRRGLCVFNFLRES